MQRKPPRMRAKPKARRRGRTRAPQRMRERPLQFSIDEADANNAPRMREKAVPAARRTPHFDAWHCPAQPAILIEHASVAQW